MSKMTVNPYLNFDGNTRQAMEFYKQVFGGTLNMQTFSQAPGMQVPPGYEDKIMHAHLTADGFELMASEGKPGQRVNYGDNISLNVGGSDLDQMTRVFKALSDGGKVTMPLEKQFWGDTFGMCTDKFGVHWMVNVSKG